MAPRSAPLDRLAVTVATAFGAGFVPLAPGTVGSALTAVALWLIPLSAGARVAVLAVVVLVGTWAADRAERVLGGKDPGAIVIDEVAGMTLTVLPFTPTPAVLIAGFVIFRVLDVVKPPPAGRSQDLPGGLGVMVDDLIAGAYGLAILGALRLGLGGP